MGTFIGVDGGGTNTRVLAGDETGRIVGVGYGGPSNFGSAGLEKAGRNLCEAIDEASAGFASTEVDALFAGIAGVVSLKDRQCIQQILRGHDRLKIRKMGEHHDIHISLAGGLPEQPGIALVAGTGSSCYGRNRSGETWQAGGWAHWLDDVGGAYWLALRGFVAAVRSADGRGPETVLMEQAFDYLKINEVYEIIHRLHYEGFSGPGEAMTKDQMAGFAIQVCRSAEAGDSEALRIVKEGVSELALMVKTVAEQLKLDPSDQKLVLTGSVANHPFITHQLIKQLPGVQLMKPEFPPVVGALMEAMNLAGIRLDSEVLMNLRKTLPEGIA